MDKKEAQRLERRIHMDAPTLHVTISKIGNGEYVCVVGPIWIWDEQEWEKCKNYPDIRAKCLIAAKEELYDTRLSHP